MSRLYLETKRMTLIETLEDDAELFYGLDADPDVMTYISGGEPSSLDFCKAAVGRCLAQYERYDHKFGLWWAQSKKNDELLGWFLLRPDKLHPERVENPELGYRFKKEHWGRGYATEGAMALRDKAFLDLGCKSIYAVAMKENLGSQKVMQKIGMSFLGEYKQDECFAPGKDTSAVHYKITKEEWENVYKD